MMEPEQAKELIRRLHALAASSPEMAGTANLYAAIWPRILEAEIEAVPIAMDAAEAAAKLEKDIPLLQGFDFEVDGGAVRALAIDILRAVEENGDVTAYKAGARSLRQAIEDSRLDFAGLLPSVFAGESEPVVSAAEQLQLDSGLLWTLSNFSCRPVFYSYRAQLAPLTEGNSWQKCYCSICGATPLLAELQGNNQARHLRCGRCGADWQFSRLRCVFCDNDDHRTLGLLYTDEKKDTMRVETCDRCKGYIRTRIAFSPSDPNLLPVEDLAMLSLDYVAQARGYTRGVCRQAAQT